MKSFFQHEDFLELPCLYILHDDYFKMKWFILHEAKKVSNFPSVQENSYEIPLDLKFEGVRLSKNVKIGKWRMNLEFGVNM